MAGSGKITYFLHIFHTDFTYLAHVLADISRSDLAHIPLWFCVYPQVLGNLACSDDLRELVLKHGALAAVVGAMQRHKGDADGIRVASWALCNLVAGNKAAQRELAISLGVRERVFSGPDSSDFLHTSYLFGGPSEDSNRIHIELKGHGCFDKDISQL